MNCKTTGLITPPYTNIMQHYHPSAKSDSAISDLCAQTVCFLWFESLPTLHEAASQAFPHPRLPDSDSLAKPEFVKWTREVLSTTQVSMNVVILAMLYIYRLKLANPSVKGRAGSEYRLLTVALMLGNKFLDDNTYTNKTWAEVTSISVKEIHLMEVEFLSNVRYQLMVSLDEWQQWLQKINMFVAYQQKQLMSRANALISLPSPPAFYELSGSAGSAGIAMNGFKYQLLNPVQHHQQLAVDSRGRKRSLGDYSSDIHTMLPPHKRLLSQPVTPRKGNQNLRSRARDIDSHDTSPSRRAAHTSARVPQTKLIPAFNPKVSGALSHCSLSPSYLQIGAVASAASSPTNSSVSQFSSHSHGAGYGYSPTSLALQHRTSPYAPVQPVQRLVHQYQPYIGPPQNSLQLKQSLWYSQIAAGNQHPMYRGQVPLSVHGSPYVQYPVQGQAMIPSMSRQ